MSCIQSSNFVHNQTCNASEGVRQVAVAAAGSNQSAVRAADIAHYRNVKASCIANNNYSGIASATYALRELGTGRKALTEETKHG
jgi:hypothetical protein